MQAMSALDEKHLMEGSTTPIAVKWADPLLQIKKRRAVEDSNAENRMVSMSTYPAGGCRRNHAPYPILIAMQQQCFVLALEILCTPTNMQQRCPGHTEGQALLSVACALCMLSVSHIVCVVCHAAVLCQGAAVCQRG